MYRPLAHPSQFAHEGWRTPDVARSGHLDGLIALQQIGTRLQFSRNHDIYAQGQGGGLWCEVLAGAVRITKLRSDGRRHIAEFCVAGDAFGLDRAAEREFSAEAVVDAVVMRYTRAATERLIDNNPAVARLLRDMTLASSRSSCRSAASRTRAFKLPTKPCSAVHSTRARRPGAARLAKLALGIRSRTLPTAAAIVSA
jgi:CRP-like cAMP-binding protein